MISIEKESNCYLHLVVESDFDDLSNGSILFELDKTLAQQPKPMPRLSYNGKLFVGEIKLPPAMP